MALWEALGLLTPPPKKAGVEEATIEAYKQVAEENWRRSLEQAPHGSPWHTSFHASRFPGADPMSCDRQAMYEMMNIPAPKPAGVAIISMGDAGKDIENQIVSRWHAAGILLTEPVGGLQTGFADPDTWTTVSIDAALDLRPETDYVTPVDVKSKDPAVVEQMIAGQRGAFPEHVRQLMVQVHYCRQFHDAMGWGKMGLKPSEGGSLLYVSRARPLGTMCEFHFDYDEEMMRVGLERNIERRRMFEEDELPPRNPEWEWTQVPCKWCLFRTPCKADVRKDTDRLTQSAAIRKAKKVVPEYDYEAQRRTVFARWEKEVKKHDGTSDGDA